MRILWVKADKLLPVQNGGNIRTYHVLRYLSARHELTFYSMLADHPRSFAQVVIMLLRGLELRHRDERAAVETAARYGWRAIGERFSEVLRPAARKKSLAVRAIPARLAEKKA